MNKFIGLALAASTAVVTVSVANAAERCGRGYHRNAYGHCRPNVRPPVAAVVAPAPVAVGVAVRPPALVVGRYYPGRGYWYGGRYWHRRYRYGNGWRYR